MNNNYGNRLIGLGNTVVVLGIIISVIAGIAFVTQKGIFVIVGLLILGIGILISTVIGLFLQAFGQLVQSTHEINYKLNQISSPAANYQTLNTQRQTASPVPEIRCPACGWSTNNLNAKFCYSCGAKLNDRNTIYK